ncbi:MAG: twin-arginine translocase TatA/TatE family subunit [Candidatus Sumerlaeia bacterium]|nr:twin-arginine translocase TatA/TatE family subunit [Candidatus Sumerlaeia bacterium]
MLATTHLVGFIGLNQWEILVIFLIILILFGPKSIPALARSLGKGVREFKDASSKFSEALNESAEEEDRKGKQAQAKPAAAGMPVLREAKDAVTAEPNVAAREVAVEETPARHQSS